MHTKCRRTHASNANTPAQPYGVTGTPHITGTFATTVCTDTQHLSSGTPRPKTFEKRTRQGRSPGFRFSAFHPPSRTHPVAVVAKHSPVTVAGAAPEFRSQTWHRIPFQSPCGEPSLPSV